MDSSTYHKEKPYKIVKQNNIVNYAVADGKGKRKNIEGNKIILEEKDWKLKYYNRKEWKNVSNTNQPIIQI